MTSLKKMGERLAAALTGVLETLAASVRPLNSQDKGFEAPPSWDVEEEEEASAEAERLLNIRKGEHVVSYMRSLPKRERQYETTLQEHRKMLRSIEPIRVEAREIANLTNDLRARFAGAHSFLNRVRPMADRAHLRMVYAVLEEGCEFLQHATSIHEEKKAAVAAAFAAVPSPVKPVSIASMRPPRPTRKSNYKPVVKPVVMPVMLAPAPVRTEAEMGVMPVAPKPVRLVPAGFVMPAPMPIPATPAGHKPSMPRQGSRRPVVCRNARAEAFLAPRMEREAAARAERRMRVAANAMRNAAALAAKHTAYETARRAYAEKVADRVTWMEETAHVPVFHAPVQEEKSGVMAPWTGVGAIMPRVVAMAPNPAMERAMVIGGPSW